MLVKIYQFISRNRLLSFGLLFIWGVIATLLVSKLRFEEDITRILPQNEKTSLTSKILKQLNFADKVSVIINKEPNGTLTDIQALADELRDSITSQMGTHITEIQGFVTDEDMEQTWSFVNEHLPLFLTEKEYQQLSNQLDKDSLEALTSSHYKAMLTPAGTITQSFMRKDPFGLTFTGLNKLQELNLGTNFKITDGYLTTNDNQHILFFINPKYHGNDTEHNTAFVQQLEAMQNRFNDRYKASASCEFFGAPFIAVSNATQIKTDILTTVVISLSVLYLLLAFFYRSVFVPLIAFVPSVVGVVSALAFLYLFKGKISAISISLGAVLLGVTVDYSLHILTHYKVAKNITDLYRSVTTPVLLSSITTALSFLCLLFVHSEVMQDLGLFAFVGIMVSAGLSLVFIPHLYRGGRTIEARKTFLDSIGAYPFHRNKWLVIGSLVIIIVSVFTFKDVRFNGDITQINYINDRFSKAQHKLEQLTDSEYKSVYATAYGNSLEEALTKNQRIYQALITSKEANQIHQFSSLGGIVLPVEEQRKRIARWEEFWTEERKSQVRTDLIALGENIGFKPNTYEPFFQSLEEQYLPIETLADYSQLAAIPIADFITEKDGFYTIANLVKLTAPMREAFIEQIEAQTSAIVIDRKTLNETFLGKLKDDVLSLASYSFIAITVILWLFFRRIELVLLTLIPITITGVITSSVMNWLGIEFNVFSMIVCTLVLGHAVDFSIFMTCALQKDYTTGRDELPVYKVSVLLASITTLLAIGTLIFAKHPALRSIASVSLIGIFTALLITFVFYPTVYRWFVFARPNRGLSPVTLRMFLHSVCSTLYYVTLSVTLSYVSWVVLKFFPKKREWLRRIVSKGTTSVLYSNPFVNKRVENPHNLDFGESSVVIANHTSWLDTLAMGMLTHRISYIVNDWVYNSPVFGKYVRAMGFFPASKGVEQGMEIFQWNVENHTSIMIFPEGTRSESNVIHRFHKGAFYVAEQFSLPIIPVYIHGNSEVQPKGDIIIYNGAITVVADAPILPSDPRFGSTYSERTKKILAHYRERFAEIRHVLEGADYLKHKLMLNFLYKEPHVIQAVRKDFALNKHKYHQLSHSLPAKARILHIVDDYGQLDFLLLLTYPQREIISVIADDQKRQIAQQSYITRIRKVTYHKEISSDFQCDTIIINQEIYNKEQFVEFLRKGMFFNTNT
ncbi:MAG: 1-acyl-sn-glycerol-3-phosphate acyltransferase [Capnocytophaga sp.]|nr:1-acyl-sn-glycerol-3-phosphate acyltransferase [Capnocytophaga sp.]